MKSLRLSVILFAALFSTYAITNAQSVDEGTSTVILVTHDHSHGKHNNKGVVAEPREPQ